PPLRRAEPRRAGGGGRSCAAAGGGAISGNPRPHRRYREGGALSQRGAMESLVSTDWLERELGAPDLRVIDATLFLPNSGRDARAEYEAGHIPGAVFLDIEEVSDSA